MMADYGVENEPLALDGATLEIQYEEAFKKGINTSMASRPWMNLEQEKLRTRLS